MMRHRIKNKYQAGFTLIEMMISITVFLVIVVAGMGAVLQANALHQQSSEMRSILDNLSFMMDDMSRNLRTGSNYHCITSLPDGNMTTAKSCSSGLGIAFTDVKSGATFVYTIQSGNVMRSTAGGANPVPLNSSEIKFNTSGPSCTSGNCSGFSVLGAESPAQGDKQQPLVIIRLVGTITYHSNAVPFSLQTSVSQRLIDQ